MSIVSFHRGLIAAAVLFCLGYGIWEILAYGREGAGSPLLGGVFVLLGIGLAVYLIRLNRFLGYEGGEENGAG